MSFLFANNVRVSLASDVLVGAGTITINQASSPYNDPPDPSGGEAILTLTDSLTEPTKFEVIKYTGVTDNGNGTWDLTGVSKGQDGTSDQAWSTGDPAFQGFTADALGQKFDKEGGTITGEVTVSLGGGNYRFTGKATDNTAFNLLTSRDQNDNVVARIVVDGLDGAGAGYWEVNYADYVEFTQPIGIGTTPGVNRILSIDDPSGIDTWVSLLADATDGRAGIRFGDSDSDANGRVLYDNETDMLELWGGGSRTIRINGDLVGIGQQPEVELDIDGRIRSVSVGTAPTTGWGVEIFRGSTNGQIISYDRDASSYKPIHIQASAIWMGEGNKDLYIEGGVTAIGSAPETWSKAALEVSNVLTLSATSTTGRVTANAYYNDGWKRIAGGYASAIDLNRGGGGGFSIRTSSLNGSADSTITWYERLIVHQDGNLRAPEVYYKTVGATNRDLYIDNVGFIGYVSSSRRYKKNIANLLDSSWLHNLRVVEYDRKKEGNHETGLIAEEVASTLAGTPYFDQILSLDEEGEPETVNYSKLVSPMLAEIQNLRREVEQLKPRRVR